MKGISKFTFGVYCCLSFGGCVASDEVQKSTDIEELKEGEQEGDCSDGVDNDGNGLIDCQDDGCLDQIVCQNDTGTLDDTGEQPQTEMVDSDGDGIFDEYDVAADNPNRCQDQDQDGCDDCTMEGVVNIYHDGWDVDGDGICEVALDIDCLHGSEASMDPMREQACLMFAFLNLDRATFDWEADYAQPVAWNEDIWKVAMSHSADMCQRNFYGHVNPDGQRASDRAAAMGFSFSLAENIHITRNPIKAHYDFMNEPTCTGHRRNVLRPQASQGAIALYTCDNQSNQWYNYIFVTENFTWDWSIVENFCDQEIHVCTDPAEPVSYARQFCSTQDCAPMSSSTREFYCPTE